MSSRNDLLSWVNELLQTNYTKVEQLGSGAAYCQIIDSVYGDVRLDRVKFNANQEYEYAENFRILQNAMTKHRVDKPIDPSRLIKCRFQDNFEFLQWLKRFWDSYSPGVGYDAVARRNGKTVGAPESLNHRPMSSASSARSSSAGAYRARPAPSASSRLAGKPAGPPTGAGVRSTAAGAVRPGSRTIPGVGAGAGAQVQELQRQVAESKVLIDTAEKERDFYFAKLREIEVYIQQAELEPGSEAESIAKQIQAILYSTDDGSADDNDLALADIQDESYDHVSGHMDRLHVDEEETF
ncbi:microtubule integrity protein mal3 [Coemansia aciculifera]|uniref:Microtubule integrity protein mal3 n=1 Tax=Coemansia aciculifera TaxID=417176 RepID=A0ACC1M758_9FUNG|nr:microtubule integrity protein mal3 [Coemansia aciculifera]KAJ2908029.1 microtubule integrity protein mal3 [Coemansia aciculifera]